MKKLFIAFALTSALFSCKKETKNPNSTNNTSNGVTCGDNPNINFTSIGTPVGKFSDCIKDVDGNVYKTVTIGTQTWMAENLKTTKYNDGTPISNITQNSKWENDTLGAWCFYDNDSTNNTKYGKLYNWYAVSSTTNGNKNVCPNGWHVPSDAEWTVLTNYLGGDSVAGGKMKEVGITNWNIPNTGATNSSLFTGLPGGYRRLIGFFMNGSIGNWWSSSEYYSYVARFRYLGNEINYLNRNASNEVNGFSVRCIKD